MSNKSRFEDTVSRRDFMRTYDDKVLGRRFVEDLNYYRLSSERFWQAFRRIDALGLPADHRVLDIGGGITGVMIDALLKLDVTVADVVETAREDVEAQGLGFMTLDLFRDLPEPDRKFDLIVLQEVIEHIPQPPYIVFERLRRLLTHGGRLLVTTPNGHRFRNLVYMALGREILDIYRYPEEGGEGLGHQHEYTLKQMVWQAERAGFEIEDAETYHDGWKGASPLAQVGRVLSRPFQMVPHMRNGIVMTLRAPA